VSLVCTDVRALYGGFVAVDGVSLSVEDGHILGVAGPNGAGKTTVFDVLSGHHRADGGRVELNGQDITGLPAHRRVRLGLARTFQSPIVPIDLTLGETLEAARIAWSPKVELPDSPGSRPTTGFGAAASTHSTAASSSSHACSCASRACSC
jgi:branched-chain amino acid transport system ATP-binding protein